MAKKKQSKLKGIKHDSEKVRASLLSSIAQFRTARIMTDGAKRYADHNWRGGFKWTRLGDSALRHLLMWLAGMDNDPDSGRSNLDHLACCIMMLQEFDELGTGIDDRYKLPLKNLLKLYPPLKKKGK